MIRFNVQFNKTNQKIAVQFSQKNHVFPIEFKSSDRQFELGFGEVQLVTARPGVDYYEGSYKAVPQVTAQTLETSHKYLIDDITICEIPFFNVSNTSGGSTVYIGKEVEIYGN